MGSRSMFSKDQGEKGGGPQRDFTRTFLDNELFSISVEVYSWY